MSEKIVQLNEEVIKGQMSAYLGISLTLWGTKEGERA